MNPTPSPSASLIEGAAATMPSWDAWATLLAAIIAAALAGWSVRVAKRTSAREHTLSRFREALDQISSEVDYKVEFGHGLLRSLAKSKWLSKEDKRLAAKTLATYNRLRSNPGGD